MLAVYDDAIDEMGYGINFCELMYGPDVLMAIDPATICMVGGPGTQYCLLGRCREVKRAHIRASDTPVQNKATITPIDFYRDGSDPRTEVCREMLRAYQERRRILQIT